MKLPSPVVTLMSSEPVALMTQETGRGQSGLPGAALPVSADDAWRRAPFFKLLSFMFSVTSYSVTSAA